MATRGGFTERCTVPVSTRKQVINTTLWRSAKPASSSKTCSTHQMISLNIARRMSFACIERWHCLIMRSFAAATIMAATYGYEVTPKDDPLVSKLEHFVGLFTNVLTPERAALLLAFPFCMFHWLLFCAVVLTVHVISGLHSVLDAGRRIQATCCAMSCARSGCVNQPGQIRHGKHGDYRRRRPPV